MKVYALEARRGQVHGSDLDTGEKRAAALRKPMDLAPVEQGADVAGVAKALLAAIRSHHCRAECPRAAEQAAATARSRADTPLLALLESRAVEAPWFGVQALPMPWSEPAAELQPEEEPDELARLPAEPDAQGEVVALEREPVPEPGEVADEGRPPGAEPEVPEPRARQSFGQVPAGARPRIPGPLVYEVSPPAPAAKSHRPGDTPPPDEGVAPGTPLTQPEPALPAPREVEPPGGEPVADEEYARATKQASERIAPAPPEPEPLEDVKAEELEKEPEKEAEEEETEEEAARDKQEQGEGIDPNAPPEEPLDRAGVEALEIGAEAIEAGAEGPGGGGLGAAPELDAWKARANEAAGGIATPDLGPPATRTKGMAEHAKSTVAEGRRRRRELPKEAKPIFASKQRDVADLGKVPEALKDDPVGAVKSIEAVVHKEGLPPQQLPLLRPTPKGYLPNLYGDPISPADLEALKKKYLPPSEKRAKNFDEMAELLKAFNKDLATNPDLKGRIAVFEGQTVSGADLPPQPEIAPAHQPDVAAVLARIITESEALPPAWIKRARDIAYPNKALSIPESFPTLGDDWTPQEAEFLRAEMQRIREAAGISKEQLDAAIKERQEQLTQDKKATVLEGDKVYEDARGKVEADFESTGGAIEGLRQEWEDWADEVAARESNVDWKAIRDRQRNMERAVEDLANGWIVAYDDMQKVRLRKLAQAAAKQKQAYQAAIKLDKEADLENARARDDQGEVEAINKDKKYAKFVDGRMKVVNDQIKAFAKANKARVDGWQKTMREERKDALDRLQKWGDKQIGRTRGFIDEMLSGIFGWRDDQKSEARAFAQQRARENTAALGSNLGLLYQKRVEFGDTLDAKEREQLKLMSEEQRTVIETYYENGKDAIGAVAAGMKIRLRNQRVPKIKQAMIRHVMATTTNSPDGLRVAHLAKKLGEKPFGAANKARAGFEWQYGTKESWVFEAIKMVASTLGAKGLRGAYYNTYSEDFDTRLKSELDGGWPDDPADYDEARALLTQNKAAAGAAEIRRAVEGAGTDEAKINEVLRRFPPGPERDRVLTEYKSKYGESLEDRLKSELSYLEEDVSIALLKGKDALADAVEIRQAQISRDGKAMEKVYARIRKEEYERARMEDRSRQEKGKKPLTSAEIEQRIKERQIKLGTEFEGKFKLDFEKSVRTSLYADPLAADLVIGLQEQNFAAVDSARLEIERRGVYADDDTINQKVLKIQHQRAYERHKYDAETQLQQEERDHLKRHPDAGPWTAEYRLKRKEELLRQASQKARADASKSMVELKGYYMRKYGQHYPKYMGGGTTDPAAFDKIIAGLTQGQGENEAVERLQGNGYLPPERELHYAVQRGDKDAIKAQLNGKSRAEIQRIKEKWQEKNKPPPTFEQAVLGELSGRDRNDMAIQLEYGEPTDPVTALKVAEAKLAYERRTGGVRGGVKRQRFAELETLVDRLREDKRQYEAARARSNYEKPLIDKKTGAQYFRDPAMGAYQNSWQAGLQSVNTLVDVHRAEVDAETDLVAGILGMVAAVAVGALLAPFTAGASLGLILLMAAAIAATATAATMATKWAMKGDAYSKDEITMDLVFGGVDFVVTAVTLGAGKFVAPMLKGTMAAAQTGKSTVKEAAKRVGKRVLRKGGEPIWTTGAKRAALHQAETELVQGVFSTVAVPAFMDEFGKGMNPLANTLLTLGLTLGGGIALGKGMQRMQRARPADFDFAAQAKSKGDSGDLIELRGNPEKLKVMQDAYLKDNPHRTSADFLSDYDDILLKMMKDKDFRAKWQKSARKQLLQDIDDPKLKQRLAETPVDLVSEKDFARLTGSKKGYAVVMIKDGVPTVILRQGAPASAMRQEGQHLLQVVQKRLPSKFELLDENNLRNWKVKDSREKLVAYDAKLDVEIDANQRYLDTIRGEARGAEAPPHLTAEIEVIELMLDNLRRRKLEVAQIGPLRRTLMGWGSIFEPQYLRDPPRLFGKAASKRRGPRLTLAGEELEHIELPEAWTYERAFFSFGLGTGTPADLAAQMRRLNVELGARGEKVRVIPHPAREPGASTFARIVLASDPDAPPPFLFLRDAADVQAGSKKFRLEPNPGGLPPTPEGHYYFRELDGSYSVKKIGDPSIQTKKLTPLTPENADPDELARGLKYRFEDAGAPKWDPAEFKGSADTGAKWDEFLLGGYRPKGWDPDLPPRRVARSYEDFRSFVADLLQRQAQNHPTNPRTLTQAELDAQIRSTLDEVLAGISGKKTVDKVRNGFKLKYKERIQGWIEDGLNVLADPSADAAAKAAAIARSVERLKRFTTSKVNVKDQGNVAESWYQSLRKQQGRDLHHEPVLTKGERANAKRAENYAGKKPDFADPIDNSLIDVKSHQGALSDEDVKRLNGYLLAVSDNGGAHLTHRNLEGIQSGFDKVRVVFTNADGALASARKLQRLLKDPRFSFEMFDADGVAHQMNRKTYARLLEQYGAKDLEDLLKHKKWPDIAASGTPMTGSAGSRASPSAVAGVSPRSINVEKTVAGPGGAGPTGYGGGGQGGPPPVKHGPAHRGATAEGVGETFHYEFHPRTEPSMVERGPVRSPSENPPKTPPRSEVRSPPSERGALGLDDETREMLSGVRRAENEARVSPEEIAGFSRREHERFDWREQQRRKGKLVRRGQAGEATEEELSLLQAEFPDLPAEGWVRQQPIVKRATGETEVLEGGRMPKGGTRPELYHPGTDTHPPISLEAKNYLLDDVVVGENPELMQTFLERTADQARRRATQLPGDAEQHILIDLRGQEVSTATREGIRRDLEALSDGALRQTRIHFLG